jgi:hypothetical protein
MCFHRTAHLAPSLHFHNEPSINTAAQRLSSTSGRIEGIPNPLDGTFDEYEMKWQPYEQSVPGYVHYKEEKVRGQAFKKRMLGYRVQFPD